MLPCPIQTSVPAKTEAGSARTALSGGSDHWWLRNFGVTSHDRFALFSVISRRAVREAADSLELIVAEDLWPMPTYREMLFIR